MKYLSFSLANNKMRAGISHFYLSSSNPDFLKHFKKLLNGRFRPFLEDNVTETENPPEGFTEIRWREISHFLELIERGER